eukprot:CFRG3099T1
MAKEVSSSCADQLKKLIYSHFYLRNEQSGVFSDVYPNLEGNTSLRECKSVLLYGPTGVGKHHLVQTVMDTFEGVDVIYAEGDNIKNSIDNYNVDKYVTQCNNVDNVYSKNEYIGTMVVVDTLDSLTRSEWEVFCTQMLLSVKDSLLPVGGMVVGLVYNRSGVPEHIIKRFEREIQVELPNHTQRYDILLGILGNSHYAMKCAERTTGYTPRDLIRLCRFAVNQIDRLNEGDVKTIETHTHKQSNSHQMQSKAHLDSQIQPVMPWRYIEKALLNIRPVHALEVSNTNPSTAEAKIAGYAHVKQQVIETMIWPLQHRHTFLRMGVSPPSGLLLHGPSGCGKTGLIKSVAAEHNLKLIILRGPELFSKYLGETEASIRRLFAHARSMAPCVLFFDEIDALGRSRSTTDDSTGVSARVLTQLLNEMDGINNSDGLIFVGCTNCRLSELDSALLRPGRLERIVHVGLPDDEDRLRICELLIERTPVDTAMVTTDWLVSVSRGMTGARIKQFFRRAAMFEARHDIHAKFVRKESFDRSLDQR